MTGLSKSTLEVFQNCPLCFWLAKTRKIERPRGIMPSVVRGIDLTMKKMIEAEILAEMAHLCLQPWVAVSPMSDRAMVAKCQSWRTFQAEIEVEGRMVKAWGEVDDLLVSADGSVSPWDFKSRADKPVPGYSEKYYQLQADLYDLLLQKNNMRTTGSAYFTYAWPDWNLDQGMHFRFHTVVVDTNPERALDVLAAATECLENPKPPAPGPGCELCNYLAARTEFAGRA